MRTFHAALTLTCLTRGLRAGLCAALLAAAGSMPAAVVFDNISNFENAVPGAAVNATGTTPNTFMGDGYTLLPGTLAITRFDLYPVNLSGVSFTGLRGTVYVWGSVNTSGTVNATTPAFGNLLGMYTFNSSGVFNSGFFFPVQFALDAPLPLGGATVGLSFNYQGTTNGTDFFNINGLSSVISYGTPPTVGSQLFNGYYRNANSEANGNFTSALRSLGATFQSLAVRVHGISGPAVVTTAADSGPGSLRDTVANAFDRTTIVFTNTLSGQTIQLTNGQITLSKSVTIDASALPNGITIDGTHSSRVLETPGGTTNTLIGLHIVNGAANGSLGGGILNHGSLTLRRCTLSQNSAFGGGGIASTGVVAQLMLENCTVAMNSAVFAGGLFTLDSAVGMVHSTVALNSGTGGSGGLVIGGGAAGITNTLVAANSGTADPDIGGSDGTLSLGGTTLIGENTGPYSVVMPAGSPNANGHFVGTGASPVSPLLASLASYGGPTPTMPPLPGSPAIDRVAGSPLFATDQRGTGFPRVMNTYADIGAAEALVPSIPNSSFEADRFTNGVGYSHQNGGLITGWTLTGSTNVNNGIGLNTNGQPWANNGILPHGVNVAFLQSANDSVSSLAATISGLTPGVAYWVSFRANGRADTAAPTPSWSLNDGALVPFTAWPPVNASGEHTAPYHLNSATFVATTNTATLRVQNVSSSDSGVQLDAFTIAPMQVVVTNPNDSGPGSLRQAILDVAPGGTVTFASHLAGQTISLGSGEIVVSRNLQIDGSALPVGVVLSGNNASRFFHVGPGATLSVAGLTFTRGNGTGAVAPGYGGAILNEGILSAMSCAFVSNSASLGGGGISGGATLVNCTLTGNYGGRGGGIDQGSPASLTHCTITGNSAGFDGGGVLNYFSLLTVTNSIIAGNTGGDISNEGGTCTFGGTNISSSFPGPNVRDVVPRLAPLGHYGGPTPTMPPLPGSPALDAGDPTAFTTDQRGFPRPVGPYADVGAVEGPVPPAHFMAEGGPWKYLADGSDQGTAWRAPGFDDSAWSTGSARLGFGGDGEATTIANAASNFVTFYFRQSFTVADTAAVVNLFGQLQVDDGVILYLNGTEIYRRNMTNDAATLNYRSLASVTVSAADETAFWTFATNSLALVNGVNVLAAEVHQVTTNSSDLGFNLDLVGNYSGALPPVITVTSPTNAVPYNAAGLPLLVSARDPEGTVTNVDFYVDGTMVGRATTAPFSGLWTGVSLGAHFVQAVATDNTGLTAVSQNQPFTVVPPAVLSTLVNSNSTWRYLDDGSNQGVLWRTNTYNDAGWSNGVAEFGYGDNDEATLVRSNRTDLSRIVTTYFRKRFTVADPVRYSNLVVRLKRDDGGVVYLNGVEIFRSNMTNAPGIPVLFGDLAANAADEVSFFSANAPASLLRAGENLLAVEIHQTTAGSSDVSFDLQLQAESGPLIYISQAGGMVTLSWLPNLPGLELLYAPTPSGPWSLAPDQVSNPQSFVPSPMDTPTFWRLRVP